jgi:IS30 family transposase
VRIDTGIEVFFCDPHSPWQRDINENTVSPGRLCQRLAVERTRLMPHSANDIASRI